MLGQPAAADRHGAIFHHWAEKPARREDISAAYAGKNNGHPLQSAHCFKKLVAVEGGETETA